MIFLPQYCDFQKISKQLKFYVFCPTFSKQLDLLFQTLLKLNTHKKPSIFTCFFPRIFIYNNISNFLIHLIIFLQKALQKTQSIYIKSHISLTFNCKVLLCDCSCCKGFANSLFVAESAPKALANVPRCTYNEHITTPL